MAAIRLPHLALVMVPWLGWLKVEPVSAQTVTPASDGTGTQVSGQNGRYDITGGTRSRDGSNLFHSFQQFGISANEVATFFSDPQVRNILGRVTGGDASAIDGLLRVTGSNANLYLMNPAGILFGPNARLDLPASFTATTASGIGLGDRWFSASGRPRYASLVGDPQNFAFTLAQPGSILNAGQLSVAPGESLTLMGGTVANTGTLAAPGGRITITAVPGQSLVRVGQQGNLLSLEFQTGCDGTSGICSRVEAPALTPLSLPALLTGGSLPRATGVVVNPDGTIRLTSSAMPLSTPPGTALVSGTLTTSTAAVPAAPPEINVVGDRLALISANLQADGNPGGVIRIGGDFQGGLPNAQQTFVDQTSTLSANTAAAATPSTTSRILVWSNTHTRVFGRIQAQGSTPGSEGGSVEIGSAGSLAFGGTVDTGAPLGRSGTVTLTQTHLRVSNGPAVTPPLVEDDLWNLAAPPDNRIGALELAELLNANHVVLSGSTSIALTDATLNYTGTADRSLTLQANDAIALSNSTVNATRARLNITLTGDRDANGVGTTTLSNSTINANGGNVTLGGGNPASPAAAAIQLTDSTVTTLGEGTLTLTGAGSNTPGIGLRRSQLLNSGTGSIQLQGSSIGAAGIQVNASSIQANGGPLTFIADEINWRNGTRIAGSDNLTLRPLTPQQAIVLGGLSDSGSTTLDLLAEDLAALQNGFRSITIGEEQTTTPGTSQGNNQAQGNNPLNNPPNNQSPGNRQGNNQGNIGTSGLLTLAGDVSFSDPVTLQANTMDTTSGTLTGLDDATLTLLTTQDLTAGNLTNLGRSITLTSTSGHIRSGNLNASSTTGNGGAIALTAAEDITTGDLFTHSTIGTGGAIALTSTSGEIQTGNLDSSGVLAGGNITIQALRQVELGNVNSSASVGNGGNVSINPNRDVVLNFINAQGGTSGVGGTVDISTRRFFRAISQFVDRNRVSASISTAGGLGGGEILIRRGNANVPFIIGDPDRNGTEAAITTGAESLLPPASFRGNLNRGDIRLRASQPGRRNPASRDDIPSVGEIEELEQIGQTVSRLSTPSSPSSSLSPSSPTSPTESTSTESSNTTAPAISISPPNVQTSVMTSQDFTRLENDLSSEFEEYFGLPPQPSATLEQTIAMLRQIQSTTSHRPAVMYLQFVPTSVAVAQEPKELSVQGDRADPDNDSLEIVLITASGQPVRKHFPEITRAQVQRRVRQLFNEVTDLRKVRTTSYLPYAQQLYEWLIAPIEPELQARQIDTIGFVLSSGLRTLPLAALHNGQQFLIERYSMGLLPSLSLTDVRYHDLRGAEVLAMGASQFSDQTPLPAVPVELATITQDLWQGESFLNQAFTPANLIVERARQPFGIVHLATHGEFKPGLPSNSYIQFWDQRVALNQLRQLQLNRPPVGLLVLSACRTAVGDSQAELGFAGLALQAGVQSALASLWYVSDEGTLALMTEFYRELRQVPTKADALRRAQLNLIRGQVQHQGGALVSNSGSKIVLPAALANTGDRTFIHPYYWSAFTMVGSPW